MSFLRHGEIYPCDEGTISRPCPRSSPWMSLQLVIPGRLLSSRARFRFTSRSYTANHQPRTTMLRQRTAKCSLTDCLSRGIQSREHPKVGDLLGYLGVVYVHWGRYDLAEQPLKRAMAIEQRRLGQLYAKRTIHDTYNFAMLLKARNEYEAAEPLLKQVLDNCERMLCAGGVYRAALADVFQAQGNLKGAEVLLNRALKEIQAEFGPKHYRVGTAMESWGRLYSAMSKPIEAERAYGQALSLLDNSLGTEHPYASRVRVEMGELYFNQARYAEGVELFRTAYYALRRSLGTENGLTIRARRGYAESLRLLGRTAEFEDVPR